MVVAVTVTTLGFSVGVNHKGELEGAPHIYIREYVRPLQNWQWDPQVSRQVLRGEFFYFDTESNTCYFPRFDLERFKQFVKDKHGKIEINEIPGEPGADITFEMLPFVTYKNDKQKGAVEYLTNEASGPLRSLALQTGVGKASPLDSNILTPEGWDKMRNMRVGGDIVAPDGSVVKITHIHPQGVKPVYQILLSDGRTAESCLEHVWKVYSDPDSEDGQLLHLEDFKDSYWGYYIPISDPDHPDVKRALISSIEYVGDKEVQCIQVDHPDKLYVTDNHMVTHNTVSAIWAVQKLGKRTMITMTSRIEQWVREFSRYTTVEEEDTYTIAGVASLTKLFNRIDDINPKIIMASTKTIRNYMEYGAGYAHLPHPTEMCEKLGIGIIALDEAHEHFHTNFLMTMMLNPGLFVPITATFLASDPFVKNIFDKVIPKETQFTGGDYDKYVDITAYQYRGPFIPTWAYQSPRGYSSQIFEKWLMKKGRRVLDNFIEDAIIPIIRDHYIRIAEPGEKFLLLCSSTNLCDYLVDVVKKAFPEKTAVAFYSGIDESVLDEHDVIISTPGSSGTGRDIKGLRTCLVLESVDSTVRNKQFLGRLRGPPQMLNTPEFVYISFASIPPHIRVHSKRSILFGELAKSMKHRILP